MSHTNGQGAGSFKIAISWPTEVDYTLNPLVIKKQNEKTEGPFVHWNWTKKHGVDITNNKKHHFVLATSMYMYLSVIPHETDFWLIFQV